MAIFDFCVMIYLRRRIFSLRENRGAIMSCSKIITITRQFGSGGHDIGKLLSEKLGIPFYDKELISLAAKESGVSPAVFEQADEKLSSSLLYSLSAGLYNYGGFSAAGGVPVNDRLYILQHKIIKEKAEQENFVVVGRCADYILKEFDNVVKIFIYADLDVRVKRAVKRKDIESAKARQAVTKADKTRANYYSFYSGQKWGATENYDLCINSTNISVEQAAELIAGYVRILENR